LIADRDTMPDISHFGQLMHGALEETLGSHIPKCVCRDEMRSAEDRAATVQYLREADSPDSSSRAIDPVM